VVLHPAWRRWTAKLVRAVTATEILRFAVLKPVHSPSLTVLNLAWIRTWVAAAEECEDDRGGRTGGARESREDVLAALQSGGERRECDVSKTTLQNRQSASLNGHV
jgi:hypothetical protein